MQERGALLLLVVFFLASLLAIAQVSLQRIVGFELRYTQSESHALAQEHAARYALLQTMRTGQDGFTLLNNNIVSRQAVHAQLPLQNRFLIYRNHRARSASTRLFRWSHARMLAVAHSCYFEHTPHHRQLRRCLAKPKPIIFIESNVRLSKELANSLLPSSAVLVSTGSIVVTELTLPGQSLPPRHSSTLVAADSIYLEEIPEEVCTQTTVLDSTSQNSPRPETSNTRSAQPQSSSQQQARLQLYAAGAKIFLPRKSLPCLAQCLLSVRAAQGVFARTRSHAQSQANSHECAFTFNSPFWTQQKRSAAFLWSSS